MLPLAMLRTIAKALEEGAAAEGARGEIERE